MKKSKYMIPLLLLLTLTACTKQPTSIADRTTKGDAGNKSQIEQAKAEEDANRLETATPSEEVTKAPEDEVQDDFTESQKTNEAQSETTINSVDKESTDIIEIKEKMFITQINDIYYNYEEYLGKTITYEGVFESYLFEENGETYYYVVRYGPGCCSNDGSAGFEVAWTENEGTYPKENDWVTVTGVLHAYKENENMYLRLDVTDLTTLPERGNEYVEQ